MKGAEGRWDTESKEWARLRETDLPHQERWPGPRVGAFSYRLVMPCHRHCSLLVRESISSRLWYSASSKSPLETYRRVLPLRIPSVSYWGELCYWESNDLVGCWGQKERSWIWESKRSFSPLPPYGLALRFSPSFVAFFPPSPSLTVPENPTFSSVRDQSLKLQPRSTYEKSHSWAFCWSAETCLCWPTAGRKKNVCGCYFLEKASSHTLHFFPLFHHL